MSYLNWMTCVDLRKKKRNYNNGVFELNGWGFREIIPRGFSLSKDHHA